MRPHPRTMRPTKMLAASSDSVAFAGWSVLPDGVAERLCGDSSQLRMPWPSIRTARLVCRGWAGSLASARRALIPRDGVSVPITWGRTFCLIEMIRWPVSWPLSREVDKLPCLKQLSSVHIESARVSDLSVLHLLPALRSLDLRPRSGLPGPTSKKLARLQRLTGLTSLSLSSCNMVTDSGVAELQPLTSLISLNLACCLKITDKSLATLQIMTSLNRLDLTSCWQLTDQGVSMLQFLISLNWLSLQGCCLVTDRGVQALQELKSLSTLSLQGCCYVTDIGAEALRNLKVLTSLNVQECHKISDKGVEHLSHLPGLTSLNLASCWQVSTAGVKTLQNLSNLMHLNLRTCLRVCDDALIALDPVKSLQSLNLEGCFEVTDQGLLALRSHAGLTSLNLAGCDRITDVGVEALASLRRLTYLNLRRCCGITGKGLEGLRPYLTSLVCLVVPSRKFETLTVHNSAVQSSWNLGGETDRLPEDLERAPAAMNSPGLQGTEAYKHPRHGWGAAALKQLEDHLLNQRHRARKWNLQNIKWTVDVLLRVLKTDF